MLFFISLDTACAKNVLSGQWFNFDDSSVSAINEESVVVSIYVKFIRLHLTELFQICILRMRLLNYKSVQMHVDANVIKICQNTIILFTELCKNYSTSYW